MSIPTIVSNAGIYQLRWEDEGVQMRLDRFAEDSKFTVTAEITVTSSLPALKGHLHQARFNLTSTTTRRTLANYLGERCEGYVDIPWGNMLEQASVMVLERHRDGEPVIDMATHEIGEGSTHILEPILPHNKPAVAFAFGGVGKTTLCCNYFPMLLATGIRQCGLTPEPTNVLILDYESDPDEHKLRDEAVAKGLGLKIPEGRIIYRFCHQSVASDIEWIQRTCLEKEIGYVVVDSASPACGGNPESAEETVKYFNAIRSLRVGSLTLAHLPKRGDKDPFGSVFWKNYPRVAYKITSNQKPGDSSYVLGMSQEKVNWGPRLRPIGFQITHEDGAIRLEEANAIDDPELAKSFSMKDRLTDLLQNGKQDVSYLAEELDAKHNAIRVILNRNKEIFVKVGDDWGLVQ